MDSERFPSPAWRSRGSRCASTSPCWEPPTPKRSLLADALARRGFAALRCDDRGVGGSGGVYLQSTYDDFAADAWSAFQLLAGRPDIDRDRIGFLGHSQGTAIAALTASRHPEVAFLILLGGLGLPTAEALEGQAVALVEARRTRRPWRRVWIKISIQSSAPGSWLKPRFSPAGRGYNRRPPLIPKGVPPALPGWQ